MDKRLHVRSATTKLLLLFALVLPMLAACAGGGQGGTAPTSGAVPATAAPATGATAAAPTTGATATGATAEPASATAPAATAPSTGNTNDNGKKILRVHVGTYPETIDPQKMSTSNEIGIAEMIYEGLTRLDQDLKPVPGAAEKWSFNDKGDVLTFTLHDNLKYSDGSPLTSANFAYSVERTCDPRTAGEYQAILFDIVGCEAYASTMVTDTAKLEENRKKLLTDGVQTPDDKTLVLKLTHPAPYFVYVSTMWVFYPAKKELIEKGGEAWWQDPKNHIGNGPFKVTRLETDQVASFEANENYWGEKPKLDGFEYVYIKDTTVAIQAYKAGQLDMVTLGNDPSQIPALKADPQLSKELLSYSGANTYGAGFNLNKEPFNDKKVREAFAYAFDRQTYCDQIRNGDCVPAYSWIAEGVAGAIDTKAYEFNPEKAKQALAESSYGGPDKLPEIKLSFSSDDPANTTRVEWIAGQLRDVLGINAVLDPIEGKTINGMRKDNKTYPQVCLFCNNWYQDYPDPQNWISVFWRSDAFAARIGYKSAKLDELSKQADVELDPAKRADLYKQANQILIDELPSPFIYHRANVYLIKPNVSGYAPTSADVEWPGERGSQLTITK